MFYSVILVPLSRVMQGMHKGLVLDDGKKRDSKGKRWITISFFSIFLNKWDVSEIGFQSVFSSWKEYFTATCLRTLMSNEVGQGGQENLYTCFIKIRVSITDI